MVKPFRTRTRTMNGDSWSKGRRGRWLGEMEADDSLWQLLKLKRQKKKKVYFLTLSFLSGFIFLSSPYWLEIDWNFLIMKCWTLISIRSADEVWTPPTVLERHINSRCSLQSSCESTVLYLFSSRRLLNESGEGERCPQHLVFGFRKSGAAQNTLYILSEKKRGFMITARK